VLCALAAYAAIAVMVVLGVAPFNAVPGMVTLLALPFVLGVLIGRPWVAFAIFWVILATTLLPDRTVVESTANSTTYTVHASSLGPMSFFALVAAIAAYMGTTLRVRREPAA
jgi:hypothetical protein